MASEPITPPRAAPAKPRFLGLLNEIAEAEKRGHRYLTAADRCTDADLRRALRTVAAREAEHSASFARRVVELGFDVRARDDTEEERRRMDLVGAGFDDRATLEGLGYGTPRPDDQPDVFDRYFADHTIDPVTGALLGRFIAEERDSARILHAAYETVVARETDEPPAGLLAGSGPLPRTTQTDGAGAAPLVGGRGSRGDR